MKFITIQILNGTEVLLNISYIKAIEPFNEGSRIFTERSIDGTEGYETTEPYDLLRHRIYELTM